MDIQPCTYTHTKKASKEKKLYHLHIYLFFITFQRRNFGYRVSLLSLCLLYISNTNFPKNSIFLNKTIDSRSIQNPRRSYGWQSKLSKSRVSMYKTWRIVAV